MSRSSRMMGVVAVLSVFGMIKEAHVMELHSTAFQAGQSIPPQFTCDGKEASPPLAWTGVPSGMQSLALILDDPDAPGKAWVPWVLWNILPSVIELPEGISGKGAKGALPQGVQEGMTDFQRTGYGGPCPPSGAHRYFFKLYALDTQLKLPAKATKHDLVKAMEGHVLAEAQLMGTYTRGR